MQYLRLGWQDGLPYSQAYDDVYFSREGGAEESRHVFIEANQLETRFQCADSFTIFETGFGTGLNFLLTCQSFMQYAGADASLDFVSVEKHLIHPHDIKKVYQQFPELTDLVDALLAVYPLEVTGIHRCHLFHDRIRLTLYVGDVQSALCELQCDVDAWYLDGFSPANNSEMWSQQMFDRMAQMSRAGSTLATYTVAGAVRRGLQTAGFGVSKIEGFGSKREMLTGSFEQIDRHRHEYRHPAPWYSVVRRSPDSKHAVILGAGIAGLTTAWQLIKRGWRITLIDKRDVIAGGASGNPVGIMMPRLSVDDVIDNSYYVQAMLFARQQYAALQSLVDEPIWFADGVMNGVDADKAARLCDKNHIASALLDRVEPESLSRDLHWLECRLAGWLRPDAVCRAIFETCGDVIERIQAEVLSIRADDGGVHLFNGDGKLVTTSSTVILCNADGINGMSGFGYLPIKSSRGQLTTLDTSMLSRVINQPLSATSYYTPPVDGTATVGASYAFDNDTGISESDQQLNIENINRLTAGLIEQKCVLSGRVSFRAVSDDRVPVVGAAPDVAYYQSEYADLHHGKTAVKYRAARYLPGVYLNIAHGSRGFTSSFLSAEYLASLICDTPLPISNSAVEHLHPARFIVRALKRNRQLVCSD